MPRTDTSMLSGEEDLTRVVRQNQDRAGGILLETAGHGELMNGDINSSDSEVSTAKARHCMEPSDPRRLQTLQT